LAKWWNWYTRPLKGRVHYDTRTELREREKELVNEGLLKEVLCMNLAIGGGGGFTSKEHMLKATKAGNKATLKKRWIDNREVNVDNLVKLNKSMWADPHMREKMLKSNGFKDKTHSEETLGKMREVMKGKGTGKDNSQYGTCWITRDGESKKINKEGINEYLAKGWAKGRKGT